MGDRIAGRIALVTGANRGIGEAIVDALAAAGAVRIYAAARTVADVAPLVARHGAIVVPVQLDVTDAGQIAAAAALAPDVDLLVNNAGVAVHTGGAFTDAQWLVAGRREMEVNYFGTFAVTQAFAGTLARNGGGAVVNVSSIGGLVSFPIMVAYSASKAAMHSLTQATRAMLAAHGTNVYGVYPGPIDTRMTENFPFEKTSPAVAARAILDGVEAGTEEIFPDPMSVGLGTSYLNDPKGLERQVAAMAAA